MSAQLAFLPAYLTGHLQLTLLALLFAVAMSLPLGIAASRVAWLEKPALGVASVIQTIPSLALLAIMVPVLASLNLQSIGFLPALIGLTLYALLPILRNTVDGIRAVDPALSEAARGVGMTTTQRLWRVELPIALPIIVGGIRTATVWTVGVATLSTPVGATSLGNYIFSGLQTRNFTAVMLGSITAALLALILDALVHLVEIGLRERRRGPVVIALTTFTALFGFVLFTLAAPLWDNADPPIRIGSKSFTEQYILADVLADRIEQGTGRTADNIQSLGSSVIYDALLAGNIDVYIDYSGTLWATVLKRTTAPTSRKEAIEASARYLERKHGVTLVGALGFENNYALAMRRTDSERLGVRTMSQLIPFTPQLSIGADYEFFSRPEWKSVEDHYGFKFREMRSMDSALMYQAVEQGAVDVISAYSTDGRIEALDLVTLEDDLHAIPPYDAVIIARKHLGAEFPDVLEALRPLVGTIDEKTMRRMNFEVDESGKTPAAVARAFLRRTFPGAATKE